MTTLGIAVCDWPSCNLQKLLYLATYSCMHATCISIWLFYCKCYILQVKGISVQFLCSFKLFKSLEKPYISVYNSHIITVNTAKELLNITKVIIKCICDWICKNPPVTHKN